MTPAELRTLRESLSLNVKLCATHARVSDRTWQYWERGRTKPPADVIAWITGLDEMASRSASEAVKIFRKANAAGESGSPVVFLRYPSDEVLEEYNPEMKGLPASYHAAIVSRARLELWKEGVPSIIIYFEPDQYQEWLGDRKDTESMRAAWAAENA